MPSPSSECLYCTRNEVLDKLMIKIGDLEVSELFLFREQSHPGRCNVVYRGHGVEFHELDDEQRNALMRDVARAGKAVAAVFNPDKINYGSYADKLSHLHFHLVPKYRDGFEFGGIFEMNPQKTYLSETQYKEMINKLRNALQGNEFPI